MILCCYTNLHPATRSSLAILAPSAELIDVSGSPYAYWEQISKRWNGVSDLIVVEQDIEIHPGVIPGFADCPEPWCVYPYQIHSRGTLIDFGLGCVCFSAEVQQMIDPKGIRSDWRHLDCKISWAMNAARIVQCVHWPGVQHHNEQVLRCPSTNRMRWHRINPDLRDERA